MRLCSLSVFTLHNFKSPRILMMKIYVPFFLRLKCSNEVSCDMSVKINSRRLSARVVLAPIPKTSVGTRFRYFGIFGT